MGFGDNEKSNTQMITNVDYIKHQPFKKVYETMKDHDSQEIFKVGEVYAISRARWIV
jgi:hypothetical protein